MYAANKLQIRKLLFAQQWLLGIDKFTLFTTLNCAGCESDSRCCEWWKCKIYKIHRGWMKLHFFFISLSLGEHAIRFAFFVHFYFFFLLCPLQREVHEIMWKCNFPLHNSRTHDNDERRLCQCVAGRQEEEEKNPTQLDIAAQHQDNGKIESKK